jgi:hypothetical protein
MTCSIGSVTLVSARASDVEPRQERRSRRRGGHNGGFKPGLFLFLIGIAALVGTNAKGVASVLRLQRHADHRPGALQIVEFIF